MEEKALGLIETRGFIGVVEAADAAVKAADVVLADFEISTGGMVMIKLVGDVAAVKAAVDAGAAAAERVGMLVSKHVIPRPYGDVLKVMGLDNPPAKEVPEEPRENRDYDLDSMTVVELRKIAREIEGIEIRGREVSKASKDQLIAAIRKAKKV